MRIGLVTSTSFPRPEWRDADSPLVMRHLDADLVAWDDPDQDWTSFDGLVLQSPWSMWEKLDEFAAWLDARTGTPMLNPPDVVRLGSDKRYLAGVEGAVPTVFVTDARRDLPTAFPAEHQRRRTLVVKPVSAGGSLGAREFRPDQLDEAIAYVEQSPQPMLAQPYMEAIDTHRELGVLTLNGEISHAITKAPIIRPGTDERLFHPDPRPYELSSAQRETVMRTYDELFRNTAAPLSVRLDFIMEPGRMWLLEAEMVAPVKFFGMFPDECRRYAEAIKGRF
jgi:hypothetical protein